jgi:protocatechuate 3,4-dioxygenase beta subunit
LTPLAGILLSDVLGLSLLVDALSHPKPEGCTESTVLGPFETSDCEEKEVGDTIASEGKGEYMYVSGRLTNTKGEPVPNAAIEGA